MAHSGGSGRTRVAKGICFSGFIANGAVPASAYRRRAQIACSNEP
jgi:hypothetical protein